MSNEPAFIQHAPAPFSGVVDPENDLPPDFVLRSSDGVDFYVHREILRYASRFFDDMFAMPAGDNSDLQRDGKPVVGLHEPQSVLFRLLRLAYPAYTLANYTLDQEGLDTFVAVYQTAQKYQFLHVQSILKEMLDNPALIHAQPHRLFGIAQLCDVPEVSRKAALSTLSSPLSYDIPAFPEKKLLSWEDTHTLTRFHQLCGLNAAEIAKENLVDHSNSAAIRPLSWILNADNKVFTWWNYNNHSPECDGHCVPYWSHGAEKVRSGSKAPVQWFKDHIARLAEQLDRCSSRAKVEREARSVANRRILDACCGCSKNADTELTFFADLLADRVDLANNCLAEEMFR